MSIIYYTLGLSTLALIGTLQRNEWNKMDKSIEAMYS